jgi:hypothetical protein
MRTVRIGSTVPSLAARDRGCPKDSSGAPAERQSYPRYHFKPGFLRAFFFFGVEHVPSAILLLRPVVQLGALPLHRHRRKRRTVPARHHNNGTSKWTRRYAGTWQLIWQRHFSTIGDAQRFEKRLKKQTGGAGFYALTGLNSGNPPGS